MKCGARRKNSQWRISSVNVNYSYLSEGTPLGSIQESKRLRDRRWLWIRILETKDITDIKNTLFIKRKPKKQVPPSHE
jgi:hypothetical protein